VVGIDVRNLRSRRDPATVELRYPAFDVRFIAFALSLPTHPWCVNKTVVRTAMSGRLPNEICARPKSPLAVDPFRTHGRLTKADIAADIEAAPELQRISIFVASPRPSGTIVC
jgi:hypothetical protein